MFNWTFSTSIQIHFPFQSNPIQFSSTQSNSIQSTSIPISNSVELNSISSNPIQSNSVPFKSLQNSIFNVQYSTQRCPLQSLPFYNPIQSNSNPISNSIELNSKSLKSNPIQFSDKRCGDRDGEEAANGAHRRGRCVEDFSGDALDGVRLLGAWSGLPRPRTKEPEAGAVLLQHLSGGMLHTIEMYFVDIMICKYRAHTHIHTLLFLCLPLYRLF